MLNTVSTVTCKGSLVSKIAGCVRGGVICSNHGSCNDHACACSTGWEGEFCESMITSDSVLTPVLASVLPASAGLVLLMLVLAIVFVFARRRANADDWEIDYEELQLSDLIGEGGYVGFLAPSVCTPL
jgi:hypothetical protein